MALTYYIRSWDPRSTYPTNPQEGDICYTITLDQTWAPVGGVKKDNIVKEEIYQNGAWVEQGGGGGDVMPKCTFKVVNNAATDLEIASEATGFTVIDGVLTPPSDVGAGTTEDIELVHLDLSGTYVAIMFSGPDARQTWAASNAVNCQWNDEMYAILITDPTLDSSITFTVTDT